MLSCNRALIWFFFTFGIHENENSSLSWQLYMKPFVSVLYFYAVLVAKNMYQLMYIQCCESLLLNLMQNHDLWEQVVCATNTCIIGAFICYCPKRNQGIKQSEDSELPPSRVTLKRLISHDDCRLPCVSYLENRFVSKLSILEISSAENK